MANIKANKKAVRQTAARTQRNRTVRTRLKSVVKAFGTAPTADARNARPPEGRHGAAVGEDAGGHRLEEANAPHRAVAAAMRAAARAKIDLGKSFRRLIKETGPISLAHYIAESNARRVLNGEAPLPMTGISLQQKIAAQAVPEQRNDHGIPLLPE